MLARYILVGGVSTVTTYIIYLVLQSFTNPQLAYSITFVFGIGLSYTLNTQVVFRSRRSAGSAACFMGSHLLQYTLGLLVLQIAIDFGVDRALALLPVLAVNIPLGFVLARWCLLR